jgi:Mlc titration factor MtfA (ptsG expression regulator)
VLSKIQSNDKDTQNDYNSNKDAQSNLLSLKPVSKYRVKRLRRTSISEKTQDNLIDILDTYVSFYKKLDDTEKIQFQDDVNWFLEHINIIGIDTKVTFLDKVLVAASGTIPIFYFPDWHHYELDTVILLPDAFNYNLKSYQDDSQILGLVGSNEMYRKMALSKKALHEGFMDDETHDHVALHEFMHLLDKSDGTVDGLPKFIINKSYVIPWMQLIRQKIKLIKQGDSPLDSYAALSTGEFFATIGEYFFKKPNMLRNEHPTLYAFLDDLFKGRMR